MLTAKGYASTPSILHPLSKMTDVFLYKKGIAELLQNDYVYTLKNMFFPVRSTLEQKHSIICLKDGSR